jgi:ABC-type Zn uptake system ZnuABC Zn-binding protein ZnuA
MPTQDDLLKALEADIRLTQERFIEAMNARLGQMSPETKERYFAVLAMLVAKLEDPSKALQQVLQEVVGEAASLVMAELGK